jgi:phage/plasmid-associated DNA primase
MATRTEFTQSTSDFSDVVDNNDALIVSLKRFMNQYELAKEDIKTKANFICNDYQYKKRFFVPNAGIPQLMQHLLRCYIEKNTLHFLELIPMDESYENGSGLSFDFTFITSEATTAFEDVVGGFLKFLFEEVLLKVLRLPKTGKETHHCILLGSPKSEYLESLQKYKQQYTITIPSIQVGMLLKKCIFDFLWNSKHLQSLFKKKTTISLRSVFAYNSRCTPVCLIGSCRADDKAYLELMSIQKVIIEDGVTFEGISLVSNPAGLFNNLIYECSLNYEMPASDGGIIRKRVYLPRTSVVTMINEQMSNPDNQMSRAYDKALVEIAMLSVYDNVFYQFKKILNMISDDRVATQQGRLGVIASLASDKTNKYHCIALWFCKNRCVDMTLDEFNELWLAAANTADVRTDLKSLRYWAGLDSPSEMRRFLEQQVRQMLLRDVKGMISSGSIGHANASSYIHFIFKNVFATIVVGKSVHWYEFITPETSNYQPGQLYKWKYVGSEPDSLHEYISHDLAEIAHKVLLELSQEINCAKDDDRKKYLKSLKGKFLMSIKQIFSRPFKENVIKDAAHKFANDNLIRSMDKTKHIMGVKNGVLEFNGPDVTLLDHYHSYPITMYTETDYIPYDPENKYIQTVYKFLHSLFPINERDALDFILFYFSTSLDWFPKESLFLIVTGQGCHAIDTPIRMFDGSVKLVQDITMGDQLMGDDNTSRTVQELFRGTDEMVQIIPLKGDPFVVNKNHILSLKFTNVSYVDKRSDGAYTESPQYCARWYECNGSLPPISRSQMYKTKAEARTHLDTLAETSTNIIKQGDVIDIKVQDLRKWPKWWVAKANVTLYKAVTRVKETNALLDGFTMTSIGEGDYYGFELDGNHRYQTSDCVVHHNSNGKSVIIEFFRETIGEMYARRMPLSFITEQTRTKSASADPAMMEMKHARFVNYSESERNERANIARIKELTGGDTMAGRQLYGEQENFKPNCNHLLATNHHLRIESTEHAVWRRFLTYKFKMTFKEKPNPDNEFEAKKDSKFINMLKDDKRYHSAFLAILCHYRSRLYSEYDGQILKVPHPTIQEETNIYRQQEDIYERFIVQRVFYKENKTDQSLDEFLTLFRNYYRNENGERLKMKNDDLRYLFLNSSIQPYIKYNPSGICVLHNVYTVDETAPVLDGSILFKEYLKTAPKQ